MRRQLDAVSQRTLLGLARTAIRDHLTQDGSLERALSGIDLAGPLQDPRGAFVTLRERVAGGAHGALRGCIGTTETEKPLYRSVIDGAVHAAVRDPRFPSLTIDELPSVTIEISALTPLVAVTDPEEIVTGRDGVTLEQDVYRSVFLPHVATEQGWDRAELLAQLALKAGLPRDGWKQAQLRRFEAEVFVETEGGP